MVIHLIVVKRTEYDREFKNSVKKTRYFRLPFIATGKKTTYIIGDRKVQKKSTVNGSKCILTITGWKKRYGTGEYRYGKEGMGQFRRHKDEQKSIG